MGNGIPEITIRPLPPRPQSQTRRESDIKEKIDFD